MVIEWGSTKEHWLELVVTNLHDWEEMKADHGLENGLFGLSKNPTN